MKGQALKLSFNNPLVYESKYINEYLDEMKNMRKNTYISARARLSYFEEFTDKIYHMNADRLIESIKADKFDRYKVMAAYAGFLKNDKQKSANNRRKRVIAAREMLELHSIEFLPRQFKQKVKLERGIKRVKTATDKTQITTLLSKIQEPFLNLALLWHAATGRRPEEIFSLRHCDLDFKRRVFRIRGEYTKMGDEQERPMTKELAERTEHFMNWKHRPRRISFTVGPNKYKQIILTEKDIKVRPTDLLFQEYYRNDTHFIPSIDSVYNKLQANLAEVLDSNGMGERVNPDDPRSPRKFTFYRLRDHVKTTISDLGHADFGEFMLGHRGSTYYNQPEKKRAEIFSKIELSLTYLDYAGLEARGADNSSRIDALQNENLDLKRNMGEMIKKEVHDYLVGLYRENPSLLNAKPEELVKLKSN